MKKIITILAYILVTIVSLNFGVFVGKYLAVAIIESGVYPFIKNFFEAIVFTL
jgi:hypothetical protein